MDYAHVGLNCLETRTMENEERNYLGTHATLQPKLFNVSSPTSSSQVAFLPAPQ